MTRFRATFFLCISLVFASTVAGQSVPGSTNSPDSSPGASWQQITSPEKAGWSQQGSQGPDSALPRKANLYFRRPPSPALDQACGFERQSSNFSRNLQSSLTQGSALRLLSCMERSTHFQAVWENCSSRLRLRRRLHTRSALISDGG
jgi:hypothetical protein